MKLPGLIALASLTLTGAGSARAADATTPVDYTRRNTPFAPAANVTPDKQSPQTNATVQDKRVEKNIVDKQPAAVGDRRAAIDVQETRDKNIREKDSRRPEVVEQKLSSFNGRTAPISTGADTTKPPIVTKYQDGLTSASATNMARFPALGSATGAKINRFVFRKNAPDPDSPLVGAAVTPAAGAAAVQKK